MGDHDNNRDHTSLEITAPPLEENRLLLPVTRCTRMDVRGYGEIRITQATGTDAAMDFTSRCRKLSFLKFLKKISEKVNFPAFRKSDFFLKKLLLRKTPFDPYEHW